MIRRFPRTLTSNLHAHVATDLERSPRIYPSEQLPWQCEMVAVKISVDIRLRDLCGREVILYSDSAYCPMEDLEDKFGRHRSLKLVLLDLWIEELHIYM